MNRKDRTVYIMLTDYPDKVSRTIKKRVLCYSLNSKSGLT